MQIDNHFIDIGLGIALSLVTQIAKQFHTKPFTVFKVIAFVVAVIYGVVAFFGYQEALASILGSVITIVGIASGFWSVIMRQDSPFMVWWNSRKK